MYGDAAVSSVIECHKRFIEGRNGIENEQRVGCPCSIKSDENISKRNDIGDLAQE